MRAPSIDLTGSRVIDAIDSTGVPYPITIDANDEQLWRDAGCSGQVLHYRAIADGAIGFYNPRTGDDLIGCDIGYCPELPNSWAALKGWRTVPVTQDGHLTVADGGHRAVLRPAGSLEATRFQGKWQIVGMDGKALDEDCRVSLNVSEDEIRWEPRCAGNLVRYVSNGPHFATVEPPPINPRPLNTQLLPLPPFCAVRPPTRLPKGMDALQAGDRIERTDAGSIRISGGEHSVTLVSQS